MAVAPIAAEPAANTKAAENPDKTEPPAEMPDPEKTVATCEFVWHYEHNPVLVPQEITQKDWNSDSKELVQSYIIEEPSTKQRQQQRRNRRLGHLLLHAQGRSSPSQE